MSDVSDGGWHPPPVYLQINESVPDDATLVASAPDPQGDTFEVKLAPVAYPAQGPQTLTVRLCVVGASAGASATITLLQGSKVIASQVVQPSSSFADYALSLTPAQIALITDYTDLRVRVTAGSPSISCCPGVAMPAVLYLTGSPVIPGTVPLAYDGSQFYVGTDSNGQEWRWSCELWRFVGGTIGWAPVACLSTSLQCSPLLYQCWSGDTTYTVSQ